MQRKVNAVILLIEYHNICSNKQAALKHFEVNTWLFVELSAKVSPMRSLWEIGGKEALECLKI